MKKISIIFLNILIVIKERIISINMINQLKLIMKELLHGYHKFYENYFAKIKDNNLDILEIGSFRGNASAALFFYLQILI